MGDAAISYFKECLLIVMLAATQGCVVEPEGASPQPSASDAPAKAPAAIPADTLRALAQTALAEQHYYAPAGNSAIDHYLALRQLSPGDAGVDGALTQLQPYLLIASEQALVRGDLAEAQRLLTLLERVDAAAPALPRLRDGLRGMALARRESEGAAAAAAAATESARMAAEARARETAQDAVRAGRSTAVVEVPAAPRLQAPATEPLPAPRTAPVAEIAVPATASTSRPPPARVAPQLLNDAAPRYPPSALKRRIEGYVQVAFTIQPDGRIAGVRVVASTPADVFDAAALAAVARWRFEATGQSFSTQRTLDFRLPRGG